MRAQLTLPIIRRIYNYIYTYILQHNKEQALVEQPRDCDVAGRHNDSGPTLRLRGSGWEGPCPSHTYPPPLPKHSCLNNTPCHDNNQREPVMFSLGSAREVLRIPHWYYLWPFV